ncbi:MAG: 50S ribosomal protein L1 [Planctomycetes bacterium]|nr:50S ribosomal protein L1 [Planctomycetota bacterium]
MAKRSVLYRKQLEIAGDPAKPVSLDEAVAKVKKMAAERADRTYKNGRKRKSSDQTVELVVHLGIDPKHADQMIRGALSLPKGLGKSRSVIAFCDGAIAEAAKAAGALEAGGEELIAKVEGGWLDFDVAIAHPSMMGKVGKLGRVLGPQGKMPTPKAGTVTPDVATAVKEFGAGRLEFRNDDGGNVHLPVGKSSFSAADLKENIDAVLKHLLRVRPAAAKGHYIKRVCLSGTRTPAVSIEVAA